MILEKTLECPLCWQEMKPILKEISPEYSLEGLMLKLKLQYFVYLMWITDSLEKTLMLGKIEGKRRRGWQRIRWLGGITNSWSLLKFMSIESVHDAIQPFHPLSPPSPPAFNLSQHQVFSNESVLHIRWPKYWCFSFSMNPSNEYSGLISFKIGLISLQSKGLSRVFSNITVQKHQFFGAQLSL